jgi:hypothetical protein
MASPATKPTLSAIASRRERGLINSTSAGSNVPVAGAIVPLLMARPNPGLLPGVGMPNVGITPAGKDDPPPGCSA